MVYVYDIIFVFVEVIVNLVNEDLVNIGGCVYIILIVVGLKFELDCKKIMKKKKRIKVIENEIFGVGILFFKCIINVVGLQWVLYDDNYKLNCLENFYFIIRKVLDILEKEKIKFVVIFLVSLGKILFFIVE